MFGLKLSGPVGDLHSAKHKPVKTGRIRFRTFSPEYICILSRIIIGLWLQLNLMSPGSLHLV